MKTNDDEKRADWFDWKRDTKQYKPRIEELFFKWLIIFWFVFFFGLMAWVNFSDAGEVQEPELTHLLGWESTRDRNVILKFQDKAFKHEVLNVPEFVPECNGVKQQGNEVWLLTQEINPVLYIIARTPTAYQLPGEVEWTGLIEKTFVERKWE